MAAKRSPFLGAAWSNRWARSYGDLSPEQQKGVDKVVLALIKQQPTPGMRIKPVEPGKYYNEARINDGDRLIHRIENGRVYFVDVVRHDDIGRYGKAIPGMF